VLKESRRFGDVSLTTYLLLLSRFPDTVGSGSLLTVDDITICILGMLFTTLLLLLLYLVLYGELEYLFVAMVTSRCCARNVTPNFIAAFWRTGD
jgi:hypothetical protein